MTPGKNVKEKKSGEVGVVISRTDYVDERGSVLVVEFGEGESKQSKTLKLDELTEVSE